MNFRSISRDETAATCAIEKSLLSSAMPMIAAAHVISTPVATMARRPARTARRSCRRSPTMAAPKLKGQNKDYLVMALRAYRDGKRASSAMHAMSFPYSNAIIDSIATWYANQPAK